MELFTMNRDYGKMVPVDFFSSAIWTERFAGNDDFQMSVPATPDNIRLFGIGTFMGEIDSDVPMEIDDQSIEKGVLTVTGTALTQHLNDRFIRFDQYQNSKSHNITGSPGYILQYLVQNMAINGDWLNGIQNMGISNPGKLKIANLSIGDYDNSLASVTIAVPYGPLYDALKQIADTYFLGMKIIRYDLRDLRFRVYLGVDRSSQSGNAVVRFSPQLDNFGNTKEVLSGKNFKTHAWAFGSGITTTQSGGLPWPFGEAFEAAEGTDWDLRALMVFADDITAGVTGLQNILAQRAASALGTTNAIIGAVDGELPPDPGYVYGRDYKLGDIVETQGVSGIIQRSRVTEYIRSQDPSGEKSYPTLVSVI